MEAAIQRELIRHLKTISSPFELGISAAQNENSRHSVDMGMDVGQPDLQLYTTIDDLQYTFWLELKRSKGSLRDSQIKWNERFDAHFKARNNRRDVAYGFNEAKDKCAAWLNEMNNIYRASSLTK